MSELTQVKAIVNTITNIHGYVDRVERGPSIKHERTNYIIVNETLLVPKPTIENFDNMVVVHNQVESYI